MNEKYFPPDEKTLNQAEYAIHVQAVINTRNNFPGLRFFHIPNKPGDAADGFFKKAMGARAGASDLLFSWNDRTWETGYQRQGGLLEVGVIEIKAPRGVLEPDQNRFLSSYSLIGWRTGIARSCREIHDTLKEWGLRPKSELIIEPDTRSESQKKLDSFNFYKP